MAEQNHWWQTGVVYQVYPRSFQDSNGDGIGDLPGIERRLDYLQALGYDAIWLSPIFTSPMADFGYDVADYTGVDPMFGTMEDFDSLLAAAHRRDIKLILDLVPNHSSIEHPWFKESRSSRDNPKRDWYIWRDAKPDGSPPNNWLSVFGGSAWQWDEATGQYYLHSFAVEQADLNWRNPEVEQAVFDAIRFWLDKGVDGFRIDVIYFMIKDDQFRDNPLNPDYSGPDPEGGMITEYSLNRPEVHDVIRRMRQVFDEYDERVMIGEIYLPYEQLMGYYGPQLDEIHLPFNFQLITLPWKADVIRAVVNTYEGLLPESGWPNWVLGNHDQHRIASRVGREQARVANMLLLTLRGTPTCYYGDEIAMVDVEVPPEMVRDPQEIGKPGLGLGRDPERSPMQWDSSENAGFTSGKPWLPLAPDYTEYNVAVEQDDPSSMLTLVRRLLALRRATPALTVGTYADVPTAVEGVFAYQREHAGDRLLIVLNLSHDNRTVEVDFDAQAEVLISTLPSREGTIDLRKLELAADEGLVLHI